MNFQSEHLYHIYNRGNNNQLIFFSDDNYLFFLRKIRKELLNYCDVLAYCLMPTHFHLMVYVKDSVSSSHIGQTTLLTHPMTSSHRMSSHPLNNAIAVLLRSYTRAIHKQENKTGSLFQQKTQAKLLADPMKVYSRSNINAQNYPFICFNYIHQNPMMAKLVKRMEDWKYSSFQDYIGKRNGTLCNKKLAFEYLDFIDKENIYELSYQVISQEKIEKIF